MFLGLQVERLLNQVENLTKERDKLKQENEEINSVTEKRIQVKTQFLHLMIERQVSKDFLQRFVNRLPSLGFSLTD